MKAKARQILLASVANEKDSLVAFFYTSEIPKMSIPEEVNGNWIFDRPHISLPLENYLRDFVKEEANEKYLLKYELLDENELRLLTEIRKGKAHEITIKIEGGVIERLNVKSKINKAEEARLIETFSKGEYADISYKVANGQIVSFEKTKKINLKKK